MQSKTISIEPVTGEETLQKWHKIFLWLLGIFFLINALEKLQRDSSNFFGWIYMAIAVMYLFIFVFYFVPKLRSFFFRTKYIKIDEKIITLQHKRFKKEEVIPWNEISSIEIKPAKLIVHLQHRAQPLVVGHLTFMAQKQIREALAKIQPRKIMESDSK